MTENWPRGLSDVGQASQTFLLSEILTVALESLVNKPIQQGSAMVAESGTAIGMGLELVQVGGLYDIQAQIIKPIVSKKRSRHIKGSKECYLLGQDNCFCNVHVQLKEVIPFEAL